MESRLSKPALSRFGSSQVENERISKSKFYQTEIEIAKTPRKKIDFSQRRPPILKPDPVGKSLIIRLQKGSFDSVI